MTVQIDTEYLIASEENLADWIYSHAFQPDEVLSSIHDLVTAQDAFSPEECGALSVIMGLIYLRAGLATLDENQIPYYMGLAQDHIGHAAEHHNALALAVIDESELTSGTPAAVVIDRATSWVLARVEVNVPDDPSPLFVV